MRNLLKLITLGAILALAGMAFATPIHSLDKFTPYKMDYTGSDRGALDCSGAIEVDLGVGVYTGDTTGAPNNVSLYGCSTWDESGGEIVYHVTFPDDVVWEVGLSDMSCDLDLVVLDACDENTGCLAVFNAGVYVDEPYAGEFYFVVDGYAGAACSYTLTFTTTPYVPPEPVNFCDMLQEASGGTSFSGDTCDGQNLIFSMDCQYYTENGLEHYYEVEMPAGSSFTVDLNHSVDSALWLLDGCAEPFNCLASADDNVDGTETLSYANTSGAAMVVYLVIDSYSTDSCGPYTFTFTEAGGAIATEVMSFGGVKATYR